MVADLKKSNKLLLTIDRVSLAIETFLVTACLGAMVLIVLIQIFMRNFMDSGFVVGDPLVKHLVLWVTFIGAGLASKQGGHIKIDIAGRILPEKARPIAEALVSFFSSGICSVLVYGSYSFIMMEYESKTTFGMTEIPVWILELVIPVGFAIIALRFAFKGLSDLLGVMKPT